MTAPSTTLTDSVGDVFEDWLTEGQLTRRKITRSSGAIEDWRLIDGIWGRHLIDGGSSSLDMMVGYPPEPVD